MPVAVTLNVYDLGQDETVQALNQVLGGLGTGAYHSGVEVLGQEYSFGGHDQNGTGIFTCEPMRCEGHVYRESVAMGESNLSQQQVAALVRHLEKHWLGRDYDLLTRNCNNFSDAFCKALGVGPIPEYVNQLAGAGAEGASVSSVPASPVQDLNEHDGRSMIAELLQKPPSQVASWVIDQATTICNDGNASAEQLPIFKLAGALSRTSSEDKSALLRTVVSGFVALPASKRVQAIRLGMQTADTLGTTQRDNPEVQRYFAAEMQRVLHPELADRQRAVSEPAGVPPAMRNILVLAKEAKLYEIPQEEIVSITQEAQTCVGQVMEPEALVEVVSELKPEEREQFTETLVQAHVVPEEQREVLKETVRPGGYADKLTTAFRVLDKMREYAWVFVALPVVELVLALTTGSMTCSMPLATWLRVDSLVAIGVAIIVYCTARTMAPVYQKLRQDPVSAVQRWQTSTDDEIQKKLEVLVPGVRFDTYAAGGAGAVACGVLLVIGALWAVIGFLMLLLNMIFGCSATLACFAALFILLRTGTVVMLVLVAYPSTSSAALDCLSHGYAMVSPDGQPEAAPVQRDVESARRPPPPPPPPYYAPIR